MLDEEYDHQPRLHISLLKRHRVFEYPYPHVKLSSYELDITAHYLPSKKNVILKWFNKYGKQFTSHIPIDEAFVAIGLRKYFRCPFSKERVEELFLVENQWRSRNSLPGLFSKRASSAQRKEDRIVKLRDMLMGENGYPRASGKRRKRLLEEISQVPFIRVRFPELEGIFYREDNRRHIAKKRYARRRDFRYALIATKAGDTMGEPRFHSAQATTDGYYKKLTDLDRFEMIETEKPIAILEDYPALDIRVLAKQGHFQHSIASGELTWLETYRSKFKARFHADLRNPQNAYLIIDGVSPSDQIEEQLIWLFQTPGSPRWYLSCPVFNGRKDVLYLRDGLFASAQAHRLVHQSQRKHS